LFTPSASNPHPEFADEVYFPPQIEEDGEKDFVMGPGTADGMILSLHYLPVVFFQDGERGVASICWTRALSCIISFLPVSK
jgi:hypothetical protein